MPPAMKRKVHTKTPIADDMEVHTSTVRAAGEVFLEIRQYIPSLKQYGRGVTLPSTHEVIMDITAGCGKHMMENGANK